MKRIIEKISHVAAHPLARGSAIVLAGTTLANTGAYIYHLVVGRILGPVGYGELASLFSFLYILNVPSMVLQTVLTRYIAGFRTKSELGRAKALSLAVLRILCVVLFLGAIILYPFLSLLSEFLHIDKPAALFYTYVTAALWIVGIVQVSLLQGLQRFTTAMVLSNFWIYLRLIGGALGAMFGVTETVIAGVLTSAVAFAAQFWPLRDVYGAKINSIAIPKREFVAYSVPSLLTMLGITSLYSTDILLAKHFLTPVEAGYYAAISVMGKIIFFASSSVSYVLFPVVAERSKTHTDSMRLVYSGVVAVGLVSLAIDIGYFLMPKTALLLLFGESYYPASAYLGWFGIFISFYSVSYLVATTLLGLGKTRVAGIVIAAAVVQIAGIAWFHSSMGAIITVNIIVAAMLTPGLLLYYRHALKEDPAVV